MLRSQHIPAASLYWAAANKSRTRQRPLISGPRQRCCANWCPARPQPLREAPLDMCTPQPQQSTLGPRQRCCASWCPVRPWPPPRGPGGRPRQSAETLGPGSGPGCLPHTCAHAGLREPATAQPCRHSMLEERDGAAWQWMLSYAGCTIAFKDPCHGQLAHLRDAHSLRRDGTAMRPPGRPVRRLSATYKQFRVLRKSRL